MNDYDYMVRWPTSDGTFVERRNLTLEAAKELAEKRVNAGAGGVEVWRRQVLDLQARIWELP